MNTMSPTAPMQEMSGMQFAEQYCEMRPWMNAKQTRDVGQWGYSYYVTKKRESFGDGFRRMCYIRSQTR